MEQNQSNQPNQSPPVDLQSPERKVVRRRFVQSTLFPLKSHDNKAELGIQKEVKKVVDIDGSGGGDGGDEIGGSQGGKKRGGRKGSEGKKRGKKVNDEKVEIEDVDNGGDDGDVEEICGSQGSKRKRERKAKEKGNSTPKRGFKKGAVNEKVASVIAIDETEPPDDGRSQPLNQKQRVTTRNGRTNGSKKISFSKEEIDTGATQQLSQPVPDLWLEAKKTAEENSRISAGKQIHPFFSSWKSGKKDLETIDLESYGSSDKRKGRKVEFLPIHVFENVKDDSDPINWCNWTFDDSIFSKTCIQDTKVSSLEVTIGSSNFDVILSASNPPTTVLPIIVDDEVTPYYPLISLEKNPGVSEACVYGRSGIISSCFDQENAVPQERVMSYYLNRGDYPENSLWTNKYHPEKASEVCGNSEAVNFINEWLRLWHEKDFRFSKSSYSIEKCSSKGDEYDSCGSDSFSENVEPSDLRNVLLVTGPVGCGKTAAIYACAKEQGFQVIEVNASDWRNGALLKQKFGEAVGSHGLKRSQESPMKKLNIKSSPVFTTNGAARQDLNNSRDEVISLLEEENYVGDIGTQNLSNGGISCDKADIKTLILFEDVDVNLCDDRGLISTIQQLADTGKRPMILTSNNERPLLPDNLDREEVCFTMPLQNELALHIQLVCSAEKAGIQPDLIERCVEFCRGDIRKTLMLLQFWCQSRECTKDGKAQSMSGPVTFNLEAGHCILPKLIPWDLPSLLSEFIEAEVAKSFSKMEENCNFLGVIEEELDNTGMENKLSFDAGETASIGAKKEAILKENCLFHVDEDLIARCNTELSNSSGSPVAFTRRNIRRKSDAVMSDSEDEIHNHEAQVVSDGLFSDNNALIHAVHSQSPVHLALDGNSNEFGEQSIHSGAPEAEAARHQSSETADVNHIDFFSLNDSHNQLTNPCMLSSEANHQQLGFEHLNFSSCGEVHESSNLLNHLLLHNGNGDFVANVSQSPTMNHEARNLFEDKPFNFGQANGLEIGRENSANLSLSSVADTVIVGTPRNLTTEGKFNQCVEDNVAKHQHWSLEIETVNHSGFVAAGASFNQMFDQLDCCSKADMENGEQQCGEKVDANPLCYKSLGDSLKPSNGQLFHFAVGKGKEILHQYAEVDDSNHYPRAAVDGSLNQLGGQFLGMGNPEKWQEQNPQIIDANCASCLQLDDSLNPIIEQPCEVKNRESTRHQLSDVGIIDLRVGSAVGNNHPLGGNSMKFLETKTEEPLCQYSDATNFNHLVHQYQSADMSYVPESTFVPETEVDDGTECPSVPDQMEIVSPVTIGNVETSDYRVCEIDLNVDARDTDEEMGDSLGENDHLQPSTSGCPVMDECSRMDFCRGFKNLRSSEVINPVQERWNELRQTDLRQYLISEHEHAQQLVEFSYRMSNLLSDSDLLLHDREFLINESSGQEMGLIEETYAFVWHDQLVQMAFAIGQYGYFLYAKYIHALQPKMDLTNKLHLGWEMLVSTSNSTALGKLLSLNRRQISLTNSSIKEAAATMDCSFMREKEMCLQSIVESVVPLKSYLTVRGNVLHDYLSSLAHISKHESSRMADSSERTKRRRVRVAKNYLSSGALDLSQDDILKLNEYNFYRRQSSNLKRESFR